MVLFLLAAASLLQAPAISLIDTAIITIPRLSESSGLAPSRRQPGLFWTINDSGNDPLLLGLDSSGADRGFVAVRGARNVDWEDLATGPCPRGQDACLYIADIGDNYTRRRTVTVYIVPEPAPPAGPEDTLRHIAVAESLVLRYPDGRHDAEAIAITPDRWLLVITKDRSGPPRLYRASIDSTDAVQRLMPAGDLPIATSMARGRLVTGAAVSPGGRWLAVRTYVSIHLFSLLSGPQVQSLLPRQGLVIPVVEMQGEAVSFDGNERLILTSERGRENHAILTRLRISGLPSP